MLTTMKEKLTEHITFFSITYTLYLTGATDICGIHGQTLTDPAITLTSPNYPYNYRDDVECSVTLQAPTGTVGFHLFFMLLLPRVVKSFLYCHSAHCALLFKPGKHFLIIVH